MRARHLLPLAAFLVIAGFLFKGLQLDPREVPSPLIDRPVPVFELPRLHAMEETIKPADLEGQVWVLNVWASWCASCRVEHPLLVDVARRENINIVGLNYKDGVDEARSWLGRLGNPYSVSAVDADGRVGIDWGVYGVPESFVIDKRGVIRWKHIGPIGAEDMRDTILPLIRRLEAENA